MSAAACGSPVAPPSGQAQQRFRKIEQFARAVLADHAGKFPAEQPHVATQEAIIHRRTTRRCRPEIIYFHIFTCSGRRVVFFQGLRVGGRASIVTGTHIH